MPSSQSFQPFLLKSSNNPYLGGFNVYDAINYDGLNHVVLKVGRTTNSGLNSYLVRIFHYQSRFIQLLEEEGPGKLDILLLSSGLLVLHEGKDSSFYHSNVVCVH